MTYAKTVSIIGLFSMTAVLLYGFIFGNFFTDGSLILKDKRRVSRCNSDI